MGAAISLPMTLVSSGTCLCMSSVCSSIGGTYKSSIMTRITYAFILLINSLLSWIAFSPFIIHRLEKATFGFVNIKCGPDGSECISFTSVYRINFALGIFHLILATLLINVKSTSNPRAVIQNGCWRLKIIAWISLIALNFFLIPDTFFIFYGNHIAIIFSTIFIGIGLILLVDFAHAWAEKCLEKIELEELTGEDEYSAGFWKKLLIGGTLGMYISSIVLIIIMYIFFAGKGCSMNQTSITLNLIFAILISGLSINPKIQEFNPHAGLAQSSMVVFYCTYLVMSAVASEPDDKMCNPLVRSKGTRTVSIVLGALFTFLAVAYTTTRAAANSAFFDADSTELGGGGDGYISSQPSARNEMRYQAIRQAVNEGLLPESALSQLDMYDDETEDSSNVHDEERLKVKYNYVLFHIIFFLATQYVATLLTINVQQDDLGDFVPVGRTYFSSWVKIISSWVCYILYGWSLVAPSIWPERFGVSL